MNSVFLMWDTSECDEYHESAQLIWAFRTKKACLLAIEHLRDKLGFKNYVAGFNFHEYELDKEHRTEGFISWDEAMSIDDPPNSD